MEWAKDRDYGRRLTAHENGRAYVLCPPDDGFWWHIQEFDESGTETHGEFVALHYDGFDGWPTMEAALLGFDKSQNIYQ